MAVKSPVLASAQALYPKSANKNVQVKMAWHPDKSTTGRGRPERNGIDGWVPVGKLATREVLTRLLDDGFTWVNLENGGASNPFQDTLISRLL